MPEHDDGWRYDLFISYRRADAASLARYLRMRIQKYRAPPELIGKLTFGARQRLERGLKVYVDVAYERAGDDFLTGKVFPALDASRYLAVISTPAAFESTNDADGLRQPNWLCREVEHFFDRHGAGAEQKTIVILGPGAPIDRFPGRLARNARWDWVDLRGFRRVHVNREAVDAALVKVVGSLLDVPDELLPELHQEQRRQRQRVLVATAVTAVMISAALTALAIVALYQRNVADDRLLQAQRQQSLSYAALADLKVAEGDGTAAQLIALQGLPQPGKTDRPYVAAAEAALYRATVANRERHVIDTEACGATALAFAHRSPLLVTGCFAGNQPTRPLVIATETGAILTGLSGHTGRVDEVAIRADDHVVATASADGTARLWEIRSGREIQRFPHRGPVVSVAFERSGMRLLTASEDGTAVLWNLATGKPDTVLRHGGGQGARASFDSTTDRVLTINPQEGRATIWRSTDGQRLQELPHKNVRQAFFFDEDRGVVTAGDGRPRIWRWRHGRFSLAAHLGEHAAAGGEVSASADGRYLATCAYDGAVALWNARSGALVTALSLGATGTCFVARFSPDSRVLATGDDRATRLWRIPDLSALQTMATTARPVIRLVFGAEGRLATSAGRQVSLWDTRNEMSLLREIPMEGMVDVEMDVGADRVLRVSETGSVDGIGFDGMMLDMPQLSMPKTKALVRFDDGSFLRFFDDGDVELEPAAGAMRRMRIAGTGTKKPVLGFNRRSPWFAALVDAHLRVWDRRDLATLPRVVDDAAANDATIIAVSEAADLLAVGSPHRITVYDVASLGARWSITWTGEKPDDLQFTPNGDSLVGTWEDGTLKIWGAAQGDVRCTWETGDEPIFMMTTSPDGKRLAVGTNLNRFFALDVRDCTVIHAFDRPDGIAIGMAMHFSKSARRLLTAGSDGWVHLWDMETGSLLQAFDATPRGPDGGSRPAEDLDVHLAVSSREDRLAVIHGQGARIWSLLPERDALVERVGHILPRGMTAEERKAVGLAP